MRPEFRPNQSMYRPPADDFERAADMLEWVFYLPGMEEVVTQSVHARDIVKALRDLVAASCATVGNPLEVKLAWQIVMDAMGPILFNRFIQMGAWKDWTPFVSPIHDTLSKHVLWVGHGKRVVLRLKYQNDEPVDQAVWVEDLEQGEGHGSPSDS